MQVTSDDRLEDKCATDEDTRSPSAKTAAVEGGETGLVAVIDLHDEEPLTVENFLSHVYLGESTDWLRCGTN